MRNTIGMKVVKESDGHLLAMVSGLIIHPDTGKVEALRLKALDPRFRNAILLTGDILHFKTKVYVKDENDIAELEDIIRIMDIETRGTYFIGNTVKNEAGETIGGVVDVDFDPKSYYIKQIHSEKSFLFFRYNPRMFSYESILQVEPDFILVKDIQEVKESVKKPSILDKNQPVLDV